MPPGYETPLGARPGDVLLVVHHFDARGSDELTLRRGDRIELLELDEGFGDGWYLGRHVGDNRTGIFPGVFTTVAPRLNVRQDNPSSDQFATPSNENNRPSNVAHPDETTPQPSRHVSMAETISSTDSLGHQQSLRNERSWPTTQTSSAALSRGIQRTISETMESDLNGEDSPVLNETLSVIDEHITDFNTPRQSVVPHEQHNDSGSEYSSHIGHRISYIPGTETDEEEENDLTEEDVRRWDPKQTAQHLREMGVETKHCDIFEQEEITGDVLLEMDQEFIFMKEFNFGVMGRRLKTWHKIKAFQEELQGVKSTRHSVSKSVRQSSGDFRSQSRAGNTSFLPRIPSVNEGHRRNRSRSDTSTTFETMSPTSSPTSFSQMRNMSSPRPSADSIRRNNYHRRHSSIETDARPSLQSARMSTAPGKSAMGQRGTMSSFDRNWTMVAGEQALQSRPGTALGTSDDALRHDIYSGDGANGTATAIDPVDLDRGYFSGGEADFRRSRALLKKRDCTARSISHSRKSSAEGEQGATGGQHSRFGSGNSAVTSVISPTPRLFKDGFPDPRIRSRNIASTEMVADKSHSPTVTNLERSSTSTVNFFSSLSQLNPKHSGDSGHSPTSALKFVNPKSKFRRAMGLRAISDAVTGNEKSTTSSPTSISAKNSLKSSGRTDSATPSGSKSFEADSTDSSLKGADGSLNFRNRPKALTNRTKSKKDTSAYMRGLEKKTPQEQIIGCDYYGWMKKKSSNLMATWKPRLFVLRGRRLSYYYSEDDTEERGLIDISSHRVFRADQDTITSLHATLTGTKATPSSSSIGTPDAASPIDTPASPDSKATSSEAPFIFKLVPPKAGSPRGVQFTKPAIHYFQVDNIQQGRLWMAALMKATIDRDLNLPVRTTNKQKTISLRQARNMGHRPPALMEEGEQRGENGTTIRDSKATDESPASSDFSSILALQKLEGIDMESSLFSDTAPADRPSSS